MRFGRALIAGSLVLGAVGSASAQDPRQIDPDQIKVVAPPPPAAPSDMREQPTEDVPPTPEEQPPSPRLGVDDPAAQGVPGPTPVQSPRYQTVLRLTDDNCLGGFRDARSSVIEPFGDPSRFHLPLQTFNTIFAGPVFLRKVNGTTFNLSYHGPVAVNVPLMPFLVNSDFYANLSADRSRFTGQFWVRGSCTIKGTLEGRRL